MDGDYVVNVQVVGRGGLRGGMKNATFSNIRLDMSEYPEINKLLGVYILQGEEGVRYVIENMEDLKESAENVLVAVKNIVSGMSTAEMKELVRKFTAKYVTKQELETARQHRCMRRAARKFAPKETSRAQRRARRAARKEVPAPVAAP